MDHYQFSFEDISEDQINILVALLNQIGFTGFEEDQASLKAFIPVNRWNESSFQEVIKIIGINPLRSIIKVQNWNAKWEAGFEPVLINDPVTGLPFVFIRAGFHKQGNIAQHELIITPKMSFGTSHHPTTCLVIEQMSRMDFNGKRDIDFGTGTGYWRYWLKSLVPLLYRQSIMMTGALRMIQFLPMIISLTMKVVV